MRVYQLKHYEVLLNDGQSTELAMLEHYEQLCRRILTAEAMAASNVMEIASITSFPRMLRKPVKIERLLNLRSFPPFHFILVKN